MVYHWTRGAPSEVLDHLYNIFLDDKDARFFIIHLQYDKTDLDEDSLKCCDKVIGHHAGYNASMILYIYSEAKQNKKITLLEDIPDTSKDMMVQAAFQFQGSFQNYKHGKKKQVLKELIKDLEK